MKTSKERDFLIGFDMYFFFMKRDPVSKTHQYFVNLISIRSVMDVNGIIIVDWWGNNVDVVTC